MPFAGPPQTRRSPGTISRMVEVMSSPWVFQWKEVPGSSGPSSLAWSTSAFQPAQASMSVCRDQTRSSGASITVDRRTMTGAVSSMVNTAGFPLG